MTALRLGGFERPGLASWIGKEGVEVLTVLAIAGGHAIALPIGWRFQPQRDPGLEVSGARILQAADRCGVAPDLQSDERQHGRCQHAVEAIGLRPSKEVAYGPRR